MTQERATQQPRRQWRGGDGQLVAVGLVAVLTRGRGQDVPYEGGRQLV